MPKRNEPGWMVAARRRAKRSQWVAQKNPSAPNHGPRDRALLLGVIDLASNADPRTALVLRRAALAMQQVLDQAEDDVFVDIVVSYGPTRQG
jgi:hypothetical protein